MYFDDANLCIEWIEGLKRQKAMKSLDDFKALCAFFNNPQDCCKMIHVAGTNGKGSVVSYLYNILRLANYTVGTFTSPYIECFNERIEINGDYIPSSYILKYVNLILSKEEELKKNNIPFPSFFAITTLIAFMYFKEMQIDVAIIEVGIGGLLDNTNVINPILTIISNVSYDHMDVLGNTIEEIATQKLGIVKDNVPLVTINNPSINELIKDVCYKHHSTCIIVNQKDIINYHLSLKNTTFDYLDFPNITLNMLGMYQMENASIVVESARLLQIIGFNISRDNIYQGLFNTKWIGRLERLNDDPLVIVDGAHNVDAVMRLVEFIKIVRGNNRIRMIMAISANKEKEKMLNLINDNVCDELILTEFNYSRSEEGKVLFALSKHKNKHYEQDERDIISKIMNKKYSELDKYDNLINIFCGSLYFVSEVRKIILK